MGLMGCENAGHFLHHQFDAMAMVVKEDNGKLCGARERVGPSCSF